MTLETERAVLLRYTRDGGGRRGSGLRFGGTYVLTADHCAHGTDHTVVVEGRDYPATVALRSNSGDVDIAVLSAPDLPALPTMSCARVNIRIAAKIEDCVALGFPTWNRRNGLDYRAQADGYVGTGEGANPLAGSGGVPVLAFKITTPAIRDRTVAAGDLADPTTPWGGMSGAVIVASSHIIGVVRGHAPAAGVGSLTFTPLAAIDMLPKQTAEGLWGCLGVEDPAALPVFPLIDVAAPEVVVVGEIPRESQAFVAREAVQWLAAALSGTGVAVVCALTGLRGVGKTQIAAAYARSRVAAGDGLVGWVNAESRDGLVAGLARIAGRIGVADPDGDSLKSAQRLREHLDTRPLAALLVFDNAVDPDAILEFLPAAGSARVVITSTNRAFSEFGREMDVAVFSRAESVAYLRQRTEVDDGVGAAALAQELGDLPVALAQAAATIRGQRLSYAQYLQRLARVPVAEVLGRVAGQGYPHAAAAALLLSIETTESEDQSGVAATLLRVVAVLSPEGVRRELLDALHLPGVDGLGEGAIDAALERCIRGSLVSWSVGGDSVIMHRLVGRVLRERDRACGKWTATLAAALDMLEPHLFDESRARVQRDLGSALVSQVEALWEATTEVTAVKPPDRDMMARELRARSWGVRQLRAAVDLTRAIELGLRVAGDGERVLGVDHPDTLTARINLARTYEEAGRLGEAFALFERTLADQERVLGADHPDTWMARYYLAYAYLVAWRWGEAIVLFERTLADSERVLGADHPDTLTARFLLADAYLKAGRLEEGIVLFERTLADQEGVLGADHPNTLETRDSLGGAYLKAGRLEEGIALFERTLADQEGALGADHPDTLQTRDSLGGAYLKAGRLEEGIALFERTLAEQQGVLGADHPDTLISRIFLADAYLKAGRLEEAIALFERTLPDWERVLGADHPETLANWDRLADAYLKAGRWDEAIALFERNLADSERVMGADHPDTLDRRDRLAAACQAAGRLEQAIALFERNLADSERMVGADHPDSLDRRDRLAYVYQAAGRLEEAIALCERNLADSERMLGADHPHTLAARYRLAYVYQAAGRLEEAIALFERALADSERLQGADDPGNVAVRQNLAGAYQAAGRLEEATALLKQTAEHKC